MIANNEYKDNVLNIFEYKLFIRPSSISMLTEK